MNTTTSTIKPSREILMTEVENMANTPTTNIDVINVSDTETSSGQLQKMSATGALNRAAITPQEMERYKKISQGLVVSDINSVINFGSDLQNALHGFSNEYLKSVRMSKTGELGEQMSNLLVTINGVDIDGIKDKPFYTVLRKVPLLRHLAPSIEKRLIKYDNVQNVVKDYERTINGTRLLAQRDNNALAVMFDNNVKVMKNLEDTIVAGKLKLEELNAQLAEMQANRTQYEDYQIQDMQEYINNLDKRLGDLFAQYYSTKLSLPQIRAVQYNNIAVANNAATLISTTLPIWRSQLAFAVALNNQSNSVKIHKAVTDATNEMMRRNAELLHTNSVEVAKETQRAVIDIETLKDVTAKLVDTIKETKAIEAEGAQRRRAAEEEILKLCNDLGQEMTAITSQPSQLYLN